MHDFLHSWLQIEGRLQLLYAVDRTVQLPRDFVVFFSWSAGIFYAPAGSKRASLQCLRSTFARFCFCIRGIAVLHMYFNCVCNLHISWSIVSYVDWFSLVHASMCAAASNKSLLSFSTAQPLTAGWFLMDFFGVHIPLLLSVDLLFCFRQILIYLWSLIDSAFSITFHDIIEPSTEGEAHEMSTMDYPC